VTDRGVALRVSMARRYIAPGMARINGRARNGT
jgi:hypothetical protein